MGRSKLKKRLKREEESTEEPTNTKVPIDNLPKKFLWMHVSLQILQSYGINSFIHEIYFKRLKTVQRSEKSLIMRWKNSPVIIALSGPGSDKVLRKPFHARNSSRGSTKASIKSQNYVISSKFIKTDINGCNIGVQLSLWFQIGKSERGRNYQNSSNTGSPYLIN